MDNEAADGPAPGKSDHIAQLIESYISDHEAFSANTHRNSLLILLVSDGAAQVVSEINKSWTNASDPVVKKHLAQLGFELISRTNGVFDGSVFSFLGLCYKTTVSLYHGILATRALLQQHIRFDQRRLQNCKSELEETFECLLGLDIASLGQVPRFDFLWIAHYVFELKCNFGFEADFCKVFGVLTGEKDPRNLLLMFELCVKVCKNSKDTRELEHAANLFVPYFPIQFVPPRNDKIGIQPSELKKKLLECFVAHPDLSKFTLEVLVDSLYCSLVNQQEHVAVLTDVCEYLESCTSVYAREAFAPFLDSVCDAILSEVFNLGPEATFFEGQREIDVQVLNHLHWLYIKDETLRLLEVPNDSQNVERLPCDSKEAIQKLASCYYHTWENVTPRLNLFGRIVSSIFQVIELPKESGGDELYKFLNNLRTFIMTGDVGASLDGHAGFLLDAICRIPHWHGCILSHVIWPTCADVINCFQKIWNRDADANPDANANANANANADADAKDCCVGDNKSASLPIANLDMIVNLLAAIVSTLECYIPTHIGNAIILAGASCIKNKSSEHYSNGLKLLVLGNVASKSPVADHLVEHLVVESNFANPGIKTQLELQLLQGLVDIYKCRENIGTALVDKIENLIETLVASEDVKTDVQKYLNGGKLCKLYGQVFRVAIGRGLLVDKFAKLACKCIEGTALDEFQTKELVMATCAIANALVESNLPNFDELIQQEFKLDLQRYSKIWHQQFKDSNYALLLVIWIAERFMRSKIDLNSPDLTSHLVDNEVIFLLSLYTRKVPFEHLWANLDLFLDYFRNFKRDTFLTDVELLNIECCGLVLRDIFIMQQDKQELMNLFESGRIPGNASFYLAQALSGTPYFERVLESADYNSCNLLQWLSWTLPFDKNRMQQDLEALGFDARDLAIGNEYSSMFFATRPVALDSLPKKIKYQWLHAQECAANQVQPPPVDTFANLLSQKLDQMPVNDGKCADLGLVLAMVELLLCMQDMTSDHVGLVLFIYTRLNKLDWKTSQHDDWDNVFDISDYKRWCFESLLVTVQVLILRLLCQLLKTPKSEYSLYSFSLDPPCKEKTLPACTNVGLFWLDGQFIKDTATIALESDNETVRILAILVLHASFGVARIPGYTFKDVLGSRQETLKRLSTLLGHPNKRVRAVALRCREKWLATVR